MRECPECSQLIQDAAMFCRFCRHDVTPMIACPEEWVQFGRKFHSLSPKKQQLAWDDLSPRDQVFVQKTLGIVPPKLPGIREALAEMAEVRRRRKVARIRSLVGFAAISVVALIGVYLLYPYLQPMAAKAGLDGVELTTSQKVDRVLNLAYASVISLAESVSGRKMAPSGAAQGVASEAQQPTTQALESLNLAPELPQAAGNP